MGKIGRHNYEAYFLDYIEGTLSEAERMEMQKFLIANPDLKEELDTFEMVELSSEASSPIYFGKEDLKREANTALLESDYLMIAEVEGVNTKEEKQRLSEIIKEDQSKLSDLAIYHKTKLKDSNAIVFQEKEALKRKSVIYLNFKKVISYSSAAAAIIFGFIYFNQIENRYTPINNSNSIAWNIEETVSEPSSLFAVSQEVETSIESKIIEESEKAESSEKRQIEKIEPLQSSKFAALASGDYELKPKNQDLIVNNPIDLETKERVFAEENKKVDYIPIDQYAKNQIQDKLLKGKSLSENLNEGLAALSDDKVSFDIKTSDANRIQKFALNIGKFSFSRTN